jgi:hypothetical protein
MRFDTGAVLLPLLSEGGCGGLRAAIHLPWCYCIRNILAIYARYGSVPSAHSIAIVIRTDKTRTHTKNKQVIVRITDAGFWSKHVCDDVIEVQENKQYYCELTTFRVTASRLVFLSRRTLEPMSRGSLE